MIGSQTRIHSPILTAPKVVSNCMTGGVVDGEDIGVVAAHAGSVNCRCNLFGRDIYGQLGIHILHLRMGHSEMRKRGMNGYEGVARCDDFLRS